MQGKKYHKKKEGGKLSCMWYNLLFFTGHFCADGSRKKALER